MLDSFDKGASEDIQASKEKLYSQITWNKEKQYSMQSPSSSYTIEDTCQIFWKGNAVVATPPESPIKGAAEKTVFDPEGQPSGLLSDIVHVNLKG